VFISNISSDNENSLDNIESNDNGSFLSTKDPSGCSSSQKGPYAYVNSHSELFITPLFTESMISTHTLLMPTMSPFSNR
jgi:hypothetical protein